MTKRRILFVDDEPSIRLTLPAILEMHGYHVTTVATVADALAAISQQRFDVLIADLNIGQPGDGFTVVSAARRTQPDMVAFILTGYPAFETALEAIRQQVDDYVVKPANPAELIRCIEEKLEKRTVHQPVPLVRLAALLRLHEADLLERWHAGAVLQLPPECAENVLHLPEMVQEIIRCLEVDSMELSARARQHAQNTGRECARKEQPVHVLVRQIALLRNAILSTISEHILSLDLSSLMSDAQSSHLVLDGILAEALEGYFEEERARRAA